MRAAAAPADGDARDGPTARDGRGAASRGEPAAGSRGARRNPRPRRDASATLQERPCAHHDRRRQPYIVIERSEARLDRRRQRSSFLGGRRHRRRGVALLFAPRSGAETRRDIRRGARRAQRRARGTWPSDVTDRSSDTFEGARRASRSRSSRRAPAIDPKKRPGDTRDGSGPRRGAAGAQRSRAAHRRDEGGVQRRRRRRAVRQRGASPARRRMSSRTRRRTPEPLVASADPLARAASVPLSSASAGRCATTRSASGTTPARTTCCSSPAASRSTSCSPRCRSSCSSSRGSRTLLNHSRGPDVRRRHARSSTACCRRTWRRPRRPVHKLLDRHPPRARAVGI